MQAEGTLQLIAELAVAFAGFTSVVAIFGSRGDRRWRDREAAYLRLLVEYSLFTLATAVLPLILWNAGLSEGVAWRVASGAKAIEIPAYYVWRLPKFREQREHFGPSFVGWLAAGVEWTFAALLLLSALAVVGTPATIYVVFLYWSLLGMSVTFVGAIAPLWSDRP